MKGTVSSYKGKKMGDLIKMANESKIEISGFPALNVNGKEFYVIGWSGDNADLSTVFGCDINDNPDFIALVSGFELNILVSS